MTDSDMQQIADEVVNRLKPLLASERSGCEMMHRGLVDEFKGEIAKGREDFKFEMKNVRDNIFEKATGKKWGDREQVRDGISFAITSRAIAWKATLTFVGICVVGLCAWVGLK